MSGHERKATSRPEPARASAGAAATTAASAATSATHVREPIITRYTPPHGRPSQRPKRFTTPVVTPAVEAARRAGIEHRLHEYEVVEHGEGDYALAVAAALGVEPERLYKTLLASVDGQLQVFVLQADRRLDVRAVGKRATMADRAEAERATGYVAGGISPLGQRKRLPTTIDDAAFGHETILVSAGRRGLQIELDPHDLAQLSDARIAAIAK